MARRRAAPAPTAIRGLLRPAHGPLIRVEVHSPGGARMAGLAVLDTGASMSAVDRSVASELELCSTGVARWSAISATGQRPESPLRRARIGVVGDPRLWEMDLIEVPALTTAVVGIPILALLGWDFLAVCRLTCDGPAGTFSLELPAPVSTGRRRR